MSGACESGAILAVPTLTMETLGSTAAMLGTQLHEEAPGAGDELRRPGVVQEAVEQRPRRRNWCAVRVVESLALQLVGGRREQPVDVVVRAVEGRNRVGLRQRKLRIMIDDGNSERVGVGVEDQVRDRKICRREWKLRKGGVARRHARVPPTARHERDHAGETERVPCRLVRDRLARGEGNRARELADDAHGIG